MKKLITLCKRGGKFYLICLAIYLAIFALASFLFMRSHFRHMCIACQNQPIATYTIGGTTYDVDKYWEKNESSNREELKVDSIYYLWLTYNEANYQVEVRKGIYDEVKAKKVTSYGNATFDPHFYYDKERDEVFLGWHFPMTFYYFIGSFLFAFVMCFIYFPYRSYKSIKE